MSGTSDVLKGNSGKLSPSSGGMTKPCRVDRPDWVKHDEQAIFSIDVDPSSERFVTGGGDSRVKVWSLLHVLGGAKANDIRAEIPRLLATLTGHTMSVSVVRFSPDGRYIASGADDACILLYELMSGRGQAAFGSSDAGNYENWRQTKILRAHATNVTDVAWSPADGEANMLASCSLDNRIVVWDVEESRPTATLNGHASFVKGLAWDPMGLYLASQADDKSVIIWQTSDWTETHRITSPFVQQPINNCFFTRLCWSPDGQVLTIVNSYQSGRNVGSIIRRGDWRELYNMVGHHGAVTVARYCPKLFLKKGPGGVDEMAHCFVLGSHDRQYSMWFSGEQRPVYVGKRFFHESVSDVAWAPGGLDFLVASVDGTVAVVSFNEQTLGPHAPDDIVRAYLSELYGDVNPGRRVKLVENAELLKMEQSRTPLPKNGTPRGAQLEHAPGRVLGRVHLASAMVSGTSKPAALVSTSRPTKPLEQKESRRADGRRKIQPVPIGVEQSLSTPFVQQNGSDDIAQIQGLATPCSMGGTISDSLTKTQEGPPSTPPAKRLKVDAAAAPGFGSSPVDLKSIQAGQLGADLARLNIARDAVPPKRAVFPLKTAYQAIDDILEDADITVQVSNGERNNAGKEYAQLVCRHGHETAWVAEMMGRVALVAGSPRFCAVATSQGDLQIFSAAGIRLVPPIMMGAKPAFLHSDGEWRLLSLTCHGQLHVWDIGKLECIVETSLFGLLSGNTQVVDAYFSNCGMPLCILSNYHSYVYKTSMKSWMRVVDDCFPFSHYHSTFKLNPYADNGELFTLQIGRAQNQNHSSRAVVPDGHSADLDSRSHLEHLVAAALILQSPKEYKRWMLMYVRYLVKAIGSPGMKGDEEDKLREICEGLMGPVGEAASGQAPQWKGCQWHATVLGMDKRKLLKEEVLGVLLGKRDLQRLHGEMVCLLDDI